MWVTDVTTSTYLVVTFNDSSLCYTIEQKKKEKKMPPCTRQEPPRSTTKFNLNRE